MLETMPEQLRPIIEFFGDSPWVQAVVLLLLSLIVAKVVELFVSRIVRRLVKNTSTDIDGQIITLVRKPLFWTVLLIGLSIALSLVALPDQVVSITRSIAVSIMLFLWMIFALRVSKILLAALSRIGSDASLIRGQTLPLFTNLAAIIIIALGVYFIFNAWHIDMTAWLASAGIAGIAIGFAAKDTLANLFSGVFIMADSPYKIGDYVVLDNSERGKITHIGIRSTRMLTRDDVEVTIPNSIMGNSKVINESGGPHEKFRIRVQVGVAYGSDTDQIESILMRVAQAETSVCHHPEPRVRFRAFGASSLDYELLCWVNEPELRGRVVHALNTAVYKAFNSEGIEIPYAKQDLYIKELPAKDSD